jgi:hypothetical protein
LSSVVLPEPKKPVRIVTGSFFGGWPVRRRLRHGLDVAIDTDNLQVGSVLRHQLVGIQRRALVKAAAEGIGVQSLMKDLGVDVSVELFTDSLATKSMASRSVVGNVRHMDVKWLWLQEKVKAGVIRMRKVPGEANPANVQTKPKMLRDASERLRNNGVMIL